jgi:hypothetical protein
MDKEQTPEILEYVHYQRVLIIQVTMDCKHLRIFVYKHRAFNLR